MENTNSEQTIRWLGKQPPELSAHQMATKKKSIGMEKDHLTILKG